MKNKKLRESFRTKPCIVTGCQRTPTCFCHIRTYAVTLSDDEDNAMPLCGFHHNEQGQIGIVTFVKRHPSVKTYVEKKGFYINVYNKLVRDV